MSHNTAKKTGKSRVSVGIPIFALAILSLFALDPRFYDTDGAEKHSLLIDIRRGSSPAQEMERSVAIPLEESISSIAGVMDVETQSERGRMRMQVSCYPGADMSRIRFIVSRELDRAYTALPSDVRRPRIYRGSLDERPVFVASVSSNIDKGDINRELAKIDGIGRVDVSGSEKKSITIRLDPRLNAVKGISPDDVARVARDNSHSLSVGDIDRGALEVARMIDDIDDIELLRVGESRQKIGHIADIAITEDELAPVGSINGRRANIISIYAGRDAIGAKLSKNIRAILSQFNEASILYDIGSDIERSAAFLLGLAFGLSLLSLPLARILKSSVPSIRWLSLSLAIPITIGALRISLSSVPLQSLVGIIAANCLMSVYFVLSHSDRFASSSSEVDNFGYGSLALVIGLAAPVAFYYAKSDTSLPILAAIVTICAVVCCELIAARICPSLFNSRVNGLYRPPSSPATSTRRSPIASLLQSRLALLTISSIAIAGMLAATLAIHWRPSQLSGRHTASAVLLFPDGEPPERVKRAIERTERFILRQSGIETAIVVSSPSQATITLLLTKSSGNRARVERAIEGYVNASGTASIYFDQQRDDFSAIVRAPTHEEAQSEATKIADAVGRLPGIERTILYYRPDLLPEMALIIDREQLASWGGNVAAAAERFQWALSSPVVAKWLQQEGEIDLRATIANESGESPRIDKLLTLPIEAEGASHYFWLNRSATLEERPRIAPLRRYNRMPAARIGATAGGGRHLPRSAKTLREVARMTATLSPQSTLFIEGKPAPPLVEIIIALAQIATSLATILVFSREKNARRIGADRTRTDV